MGKLQNATIPFALLLLLLLLLLVGYMELCLCANSSSGCIDRKRQALLKFKQSLNNTSSRLSSWEAGTDCCKWEGVICHESTGDVLKLDLRSNFPDSWLEGRDLNSSLLELKHLNYLDLSGNNFHGSPVPEFLGLMKQLRYLNLSYAHFSGVIPSQLGNLTNLQVLSIASLGESQLTIQNLEWVSGLPSLQELDMSLVDLSGARNSLLLLLNVLPSLSALRLSDCGLDNTHLLHLDQINSTYFSSIQHLDLSKNSFRGHFPCVVRNMTYLRVLDLSSNLFNLSIPLWLGNLKSLVHVNLAHNKLSSIEGGLSMTLQNLCHLKSIDLSYNIFEKETLETTRNLSTTCTGYDLEALTMPNTRLNCHFPDWLGEFKKLRHLNLESNSLHGSIPASIGSLRALIELDLSQNQLKGVIPATLGNLSALRELDLSDNRFNRVIPASIGSLPVLIELRLTNNQLNGTIPATLGNLSALRELHLSENHFNGVIPAALGNLSALSELHLRYNQLNGVIPHSIGQLSNLKILDLSSNTLEGVVSEIHFSNLSILEELTISSNHLTFNVKHDWVPPFQLNYIRMASCKIGTQFPLWLKMQKDVTVLDLSNASISGPLPEWLQTLKLSLLDLSHNQITGPLPWNIGDTMPTLMSLLLADNLINGTIPSSLCKMETLGTLDLSENMLSGNIPNCWNDFQQLYIMKLSSNKLTGLIPSSTGQLSGLEWLHLNNNSLNGELPLSLRNCTELQILNLGENELSGSIPTWIGEILLELHILRLRKNMFDGYIPHQLCQLSSLQILDLADNKLAGTIPRCFGNFSVMISGQPKIEGVGIVWYYEKVMVVMKAREYEYTTILRLLVNMDLSSNNLDGMIPEELTNLSGLHGLNLSNNHFTGNIPMKMGNMMSLESLDFSRNQLSGNIPTSISDLTSLSHLNLSYNNLSGKIPMGHQLQTLDDPSNFAGNPQLCGPFLLKRCPGDEPPPIPIPTSYKQNDEEDKSERIWFYFATTLGYATGLWGVIGVLVFKKNWRYAYFRFADETKDWIYVAVATKVAWLKKKMGKNHPAE